MKYTPQNQTPAEKKVMILYVLKNVLKALTNNDLHKIIDKVVDINYFDFKHIMVDLENDKLVSKFTREENEVYEITNKGLEILELTSDLLPGIVQLQIDTNLKGAIVEVNDESSVTAEYIPKNEDYYNVVCKIVENNETLLEIKAFAGSREQAKDFVINWKEGATEIYPKIIELLSGKKE